MADLINDEVLDAFAIVAEPDDVAEGVRERWGGVADGVTLQAASHVDNEVWATVLTRLC